MIALALASKQPWLPLMVLAFPALIFPNNGRPQEWVCSGPK